MCVKTPYFVGFECPVGYPSVRLVVSSRGKRGKVPTDGEVDLRCGLQVNRLQARQNLGSGIVSQSQGAATRMRNTANGVEIVGSGITLSFR